MAQYTLGKIAPVFQGGYNSTTQYERLDIVYYQGSSYVAKSSTKGNLPTNTTYWQIVAKASTWTDFSTDEKYAIINYLQPILDTMVNTKLQDKVYTKDETNTLINSKIDEVGDALTELYDAMNLRFGINERDLEGIHDILDNINISITVGNKTYNDYE